MNILILISFILIFVSGIVLLYPRRVALRISGINRYDLETVPNRYLVWVFVIASIVLIVFTSVLIYELKEISDPVPSFIEEFLEWINV